MRLVRKTAHMFRGEGRYFPPEHVLAALNSFENKREKVVQREKPAQTRQSHTRFKREGGLHADLALRMLAELFWTGLLVCLPILGLTMLVGLLISVVQVVTQVQEMSLTFVPKLVTAAISLIVFGPWILRTLTAFSTRLWSGIPSMF